MRTSRGSRGAAFSLFSFQDLLTTTIGVVLLILLVLVLDVTVEAVGGDHPPPLSDEELQNEIDKKNTLLVIARDLGVHGTAKWLKEQTKRDLDAAQQGLRDAQEAYEASQYVKGKRMPVLNALHEEIFRMSAEIEVLQKEVEASLHDVEQVQELQELRNEHGRLREQLDGLLANDSLVYIKQDGSGHEPILVEIAADWIHIHAHGIAPGMPMFQFANPDVTARCVSAANLLEQLSDQRRYPLLLAQPSGARPIPGEDRSPATLLRVLLDTKGIATGTDLLLEGQTTTPNQVPIGIEN